MHVFTSAQGCSKTDTGLPNTLKAIGETYDLTGISNGSWFGHQHASSSLKRESVAQRDTQALISIRDRGPLIPEPCRKN